MCRRNCLHFRLLCHWQCPKGIKACIHCCRKISMDTEGGVLMAILRKSIMMWHIGRHRRCQIKRYMINMNSERPPKSLFIHPCYHLNRFLIPALFYCCCLFVCWIMPKCFFQSLYCMTLGENKRTLVLASFHQHNKILH